MQKNLKKTASEGIQSGFNQVKNSNLWRFMNNQVTVFSVRDLHQFFFGTALKIL